MALKRAVLFLLLLVTGGLAFSAASAPPAQTFRLLAVDRVWSAHHAGFDIVRGKDRLFIAYYDANRQLTLASCNLKGQAWTYYKLDSWLGWDGHNSVALGLDKAGDLHIAANMHADRLTYYRTATPGEIRTAEKIATLTDPQLEQRVTYPMFLRDTKGELVFKYRSGASGNGNEVYVGYDSVTKIWRLLQGGAFVDGEQRRNAYFSGPVLGPDGWFHLAWVWRDSPDASTNHDLSYARSKDLISWKRSDGRPYILPITYSTAEIVDPVPVGHGLLNGNVGLGFDGSGRVLIAYHKYDANGQIQVFLARRDDAGWTSSQITSWRNFGWEFGGKGSFQPRLSVAGPSMLPDGNIAIPIVRDLVSYRLVVAPQTLKLMQEVQVDNLASKLARQMAVPEGMEIRTAVEKWSRSSDPFFLAWSTRPSNRDVPYPDITDPSTLLLGTLGSETGLAENPGGAD